MSRITQKAIRSESGQSIVAEIIELALRTPRTTRSAALYSNNVYQFLRDLGEVVREIIRVEAERKAAQSGETHKRPVCPPQAEG